MTANAYLVVVVPAAAALVLMLTGRVIGRLAPLVALPGALLAAMTGGAFLLAEAHPTSGAMPFLGAASPLIVSWRLDSLSAVMLVVVGVVATAVMVFSIGYMHGDKGYARYYAMLSLFAAAMATLVIADDLLVLFVGWELVGACSYLLIGFWYDRPAAAEAARKAFIVTRIGDAGFLIGMALLWTSTGSLSLPVVLAKVGMLPAGVAFAAALALFVGAMGKSAQFPLHIWLPDAMEGPTPASALIHAATMVAAGVYLLARTWPLMEVSGALGWVLAIGTFTALAAASIAITQTDIKKVLAYSTISQLGFMFAALGAGAWRAAMFHLVTHAAFKSLLFLAAGSVIHGAGTQDLREMGGLWRRMRITAVCWVAGALALAGVWPLAGFFSKDEIVASVLHASPWAGAALVLASVLTGAYAARATRLAFFGAERGETRAHESGPTMTAPLVVLAVLSATLGFGGHALAEVLGGAAEPLDTLVMVISLGAAIAGITVGWVVWARNANAESEFGARLHRAWVAAKSGYGADAAAQRFVVRPVLSAAHILYASVDRIFIDGTVEGVGRGARWLGARVSALANGDVQWYGALVAAGAVILLALATWLGR